MADEWYYAEQGQQRGPVTLEQLRQLIAGGQLTRSQLVWRAGMANWAEAGTVEELLADALSPAAGPAPLPYSSPQIQYYNPTGGLVVFGGFWLRFLAWILDRLILTVPSVMLSMAIPQLMRMPILNYGRPSPFWMISLASSGSIGSYILGGLYYALMESSTTQATLGKMACGLVVTDLAGRRVSFAQATGRYFGKIISGLILGIGYIMAGFTEKKQALHDIMANTLVVRRSLPRG